ncbi:multi antimicrobial extrusion protein MatE [Phyllobacterium brassicacearum]|uniref:Multi antimicrobial extrusion protein MatE n=1 Tax=Phyllobacterium brassicacearum TaxID=314235 RepID=A0A2P7BS13_9HYPH|nr:lipopolysaccharide biosynthesis protein [Phyllobacterium brassicacearum]PSH69255.1 multi antimicrobial extrusion protein MatE [Phyllobacterium brassicacearum]TDQ22563.1 O-antigen/teichoic acid export membrane protein [Phyllobacterium brassicacearum]
MRFSAARTADRFLPDRLSQPLRPWLLRLDQVLDGSTEHAVAQRVSLIAFLVRIVSAAIALVSQVIFARWMGQFEYGIFVLVWVTVVILGNLSCLGFQTTVIRFVPEYLERQQLDHLRGILFTSKAFALTLTTCIAMTGAGLVYYFRDGIEPYYVAPFIIGFICLPMIALGDTLDGTARSRSWALVALTPTYIIRPVLTLVVMSIAHVAGLPPTAVVAVVSAIIATYATTLLQLFVVNHRFKAVVVPGARQIRFGEWFSVSLPIFLVEGFFFLLTNADVLMVGRYLEPDKVATYFATVKLLALVHFVYFSVKAGAAQRYSELMHTHDHDQLAQFARDTARWTFWPSLAMAIVLLLLGKPLLYLFGAQFTDGYPLLFILVIGVVARASVGPAESLLNMAGKQKICATVYAVTLIVNICLSILLIPVYGLAGAACATAFSMVFEAMTLAVTVYKCLNINMFVFAGRTSARPAAHNPENLL